MSWKKTMKTTRKTKAVATPHYTKEEDDINLAIKAKHYSEALARISSIEKQGQASLRIRELKGLALARLGHVDEAHETLGELYTEGYRGAET